jgi:predicted HTH domain antitoxin
VMNTHVREDLTMPTLTPEQVLDLARQLSPVEQRWLALHLQEHLETTLPERATLDEAVELYLADACSLGRAAEIAGVTRWDVLDALKARGEMQRPVDVRTADEMDDLAERLVQQGVL